MERRRLYGPAELAAELGVSRTRMQQIVRRPGFPEPYARLTGTTVWDAEEIDAWVAEHRPPRPDHGDEPA